MSYVFDFKTGQYRRTEDYQQDRQVIEQAKASRDAKLQAMATRRQAWKPAPATPTPTAPTAPADASISPFVIPDAAPPVTPAPTRQQQRTNPLMQAINDLVRPAALFSQGTLSTATGGLVPEKLTPQNRVDEFMSGAGDVAGGALALLGAGKAVKAATPALKSAGTTAANIFRQTPTAAKIAGGTGAVLGGREMYQGGTQPNMADRNFLSKLVLLCVPVLATC